MSEDHTSERNRDASEGTVATLKPKKGKARPRKLPPYHVVLLDDDDHTKEYLIEMLRALFGHPEFMTMTIAKSIEAEGRAVVFTTTKEHAELKRDQIHSWGADERVATCAGSMSCYIEPAE